MPLPWKHAGAKSYEIPRIQGYENRAITIRGLVQAWLGILSTKKWRI
jgi:hypothetical protein